MNATIEIRVEPFDPITHLPHTFLIVRDGLGFEQGYGFAPQVTGLWGPGKIQSDTTHPFEFTSGQISISDQQYERLAQYINDSINNPPGYSIPAQVQCTMWVNQGLQQAGIWNSLMIGADPYAQSLVAIMQESLNTAYHLLSESIAKVAPTVPTLFATTNALIPNAPTAPRRDPLSFDLDNDGLETVGINPAAPILFDHTGSGVKTATGWLKGDDAFLALDRNGNGTIDNGTELFGDSTRLPDGTLAHDGFEALAAQDINADGLVNAADTGFANLRLWRDLNQNGLSEANELQSLATAGIASITVAKTEHSVLLPNGNQLADLGSYTRSNGTTGELGETADLADIDLASNPFFSEFSDTIPLTTQTQALPDMRGSGLVRDLREAASLQTPAGALLATRLAAFSVATTKAEQQALLPGLVEAWAANDAVWNIRKSRFWRDGDCFSSCRSTSSITPEKWRHAA